MISSFLSNDHYIYITTCRSMYFFRIKVLLLNKIRNEEDRTKWKKRGVKSQSKISKTLLN